ncbi:hypothetical protein BpHYR1_002187 [Brachionus plicatilis]|uniref:Uncharacterized protein n=1 Tax=Brachionus plicatilis TaxID=10195 RepID=A0A3M7Q930_BRAPC|nr:hypothetical protein BpHYR1_002187 [Brachionus plicatilis]
MSSEPKKSRDSKFWNGNKLQSDFQEFVILKLDFSLMSLLNLLHSYQDFNKKRILKNLEAFAFIINCMTFLTNRIINKVYVADKFLKLVDEGAENEKNIKININCVKFRN